MQHSLFTSLPDSSYTIRVDSAATELPLRESLQRVFDKQPVTVAEAPADQTADIVVVRDGEIVARSAADELLKSVLLVNSDVYITGSRGLEDADLPDVLRALEEVPFLVRGYPESDSEKMLLIAVSRAIERLAYESGGGTLRVGFQALSRLVDEQGTYQAYQQLSETALDIHAYGVGDVAVPAELAVIAHTGDSWFHRNSWFVVFTPEETGGQPAALYSIEREPNRWAGFWTFDPKRVAEIEAEITDQIPPEST